MEGRLITTRIDDPSVSKKHAIIFKTPKGYSIEDLRSQNGTLIDGSLIVCSKKIEIENAVPISIGNVLMSAGKAVPPVFPNTQASIDLAGSITECDGSEIAAIKAKTDQLTFTGTNRVDANVAAINNSTVGVAGFDRAARTVTLGTADSGAPTTSIPTSSLSPAANVSDQFKGLILKFASDTTTATPIMSFPVNIV